MFIKLKCTERCNGSFNLELESKNVFLGSSTNFSCNASSGRPVVVIFNGIALSDVVKNATLKEKYGITEDDHTSTNAPSQGILELDHATACSNNAHIECASIANQLEGDDTYCCTEAYLNVQGSLLHLLYSLKPMGSDHE